MYESLERFLYGYNTWKWKCIFKINPSLLYNYSVIFIMKLKKITLVHISYLIINHGCIHLNKVQCINCFRNKYFPENTCSQCYRQLSTLFQTRHTYINFDDLFFSAKMLPPKCYLRIYVFDWNWYVSKCLSARLQVCRNFGLNYQWVYF